MARRVHASRLSRYAEKQSKKQFIFFGIGTLLIIFLLIQFGGVFLNLFGDLVFGIRGDEEQSNSNIQSSDVLLAPNLSNIPSSTASAEINVRGDSNYSEGEIILYVNGREEESKELDKAQTFEFKSIRLREGENTIYAIYKLNGKESVPSQDYKIVSSSSKPKLEIKNPADNSTFTKADRNVSITGQTDPNSSVTVNGFRAIVNNDGEFSYLFGLKEGDNKITIEAISESGVSTSQEINLIYRE